MHRRDHSWEARSHLAVDSGTKGSFSPAAAYFVGIGENLANVLALVNPEQKVLILGREVCLSKERHVVSPPEECVHCQLKNEKKI